MTSTATQRADRLARVGLLGTYTMLARRAARAELQPDGPPGGPCAFDAPSFGFRARLPGGWLRQSVEMLNVAGRGGILFQDLEVVTPEGVRLRLGSAVEPVLPGELALEELTRVLGSQAGGRLVASDPLDDGSSVRDLTIFADDGMLIVARLAIVGRRVLCADAWLDAGDSGAGDDVVRDFFDALVVTAPEGPVSGEGRTSGTYRATERGA